MERLVRKKSLIMFKSRLLTAVILIPLVLLGLYKTNAFAFALFLSLCLVGLGFEWLQLIPLEKRSMQCVFFLALFVITGLVYFVYPYWLIVGLFVWLILGFFVFNFPKFQSVWGKKSWVACLGLFLLPLFVQSLMAIFRLENGRFFIMYLLFLVWVADSSAYIAGKLWGRHKFIPKVSPGKTIEGLAGGLLLSIFTSYIGYYSFQPHSALLWYFFVFMIYFVTVLGDLFESMLKRRADIKDSGHILPGHGGILDRLDSLIAAGPFFYAGLILFLPG